MGRKNSPRSLEHWASMAPKAPYRASVKPNACWESGKPHPRLIAASRVSPGGRLLLAFEHAGIRDYFVAGHISEGAQAEPDNAERASRRKPVAASKPSTLDEAFDAYRVARKAEDDAIKVLEGMFQVEALRLIEERRFDEAMAIINAMPADTVMKTICIERLMKAGHDFEAKPLWKVEPIAYTAEHGAALAAWMVAKNAEDAAEKVMGKMVWPLVDAFVKSGDRDGLTALIARTPASVQRAFMIDARDYRMKNAAEASA
jgi:hypothetical protein